MVVGPPHKRPINYGQTYTHRFEFESEIVLSAAASAAVDAEALD